MSETPILQDPLDQLTTCPYCGSQPLVREVPVEGGDLWYLCPHCGERMSLGEEDEDERRA